MAGGAGTAQNAASLKLRQCGRQKLLNSYDLIRDKERVGGRQWENPPTTGLARGGSRLKIETKTFCRENRKWSIPG